VTDGHDLAETKAAIAMVEPGPFAPPPDLRTRMQAIADAIEGGNQEPRREFIRNYLFLPTSDPMFVEDVLRIMMAAPSHVAASALGESLRLMARPSRPIVRCPRSISPPHRR
jgi:hypothetical protein